MADVEKKAMSSTPKVSVDVGGQFDYIRNLRERKKLQAEIEKLQQKSQTKLNSEEKKQQEELLKEKEDRLKQINEDIEDEKDKRDEKRNEVSKKVLENAGNAAASAVTDGLLKLKSTLESTMDSFLKTQESIAYNLNGTSLSVEKVSDDLTRAIAGSGIVRQEAVYSKLDEMVRQGIVYNVEQRAFLQTLSDDLGMMFNATDGTFLRLINLQRKDLTDQRMAIQASLKTFLNQNYETSQYIANGFQSVSNALIEAQSTMTSSAGMALEATIQKWMGSLSSVGMSDSTIDALATAIGQLGSGNLSALSGSNMQNLIVMGAAQSGLSYADLLTQGVSSQAAESLMQGIVKYISQMGNNSSNVVRSEYARIFGLNVSDILAASQVGDIGSLGLSNDISALLNATSGYVSTGNKINNALANFMYEWATGVASNDLNYGIYKALDLVSSVGQVLTSGITVSAKFLGSGVDLDLSKIIGAVPLISTLPSLLSTGLDSLSNALNGETGALSIFNKLNMRGEGQQIRAAGLLTGFTKTSGLETSGSMVIGNTNEADAANAAMTSSGDLVSRTMKGEEQVYDVDDLYRYIDENWQADITTGIKDELLVHSHNRFDDIYLYLTNDLSNILTEQLPTILASQPYGTYTRISEAANTVTIGNDLTTAFDLMLLSTMNIVNIYGLLANKFGATETFDPLKNTTYDWNASLGWLVDASNLDYKAAEEGATGG